MNAAVYSEYMKPVRRHVRLDDEERDESSSTDPPPRCMPKLDIDLAHRGDASQNCVNSTVDVDELWRPEGRPL
jgi:hypothetical protein